MPKEYFEYWFGDDDEIIECGGNFYYVVTGESLSEIKEKVRDASFRSTIMESWGEEEGNWYVPKKLINVNRNCDGSWVAIFELEMVDW